MGHAGGLVCLAIALGVFIAPKGAWLGLNAQAAEPVRAVALFSAAWYLLFALPLFIVTPDAPGTRRPLAEMMREGMRQLGQTVREIRRHAPILRFLVAHMIYVDGLATLFAHGKRDPVSGHAALCLVQKPDDVLGERWRLRSDGILQVVAENKVGAMLLVEPTAHWRSRRMRFTPNAVVGREAGDPLERSLIFRARLIIKLPEVGNKKVVGL